MKKITVYNCIAVFIISVLLSACSGNASDTEKNDDKASKLFEENLIKVKLDGKYGYTDCQGNMIIAAQFDDAHSFENGVAAVETNGKWGLIDAEGTFIHTPDCDMIGYLSQDDNRQYNVRPACKDKKYALMDEKGEWIFEPKYESCSGVWDGYALVQSNGKYGYIDCDGNMAIDPQFDDADVFRNGLAAVAVGTKYGFIDTNGNYVINPQFDKPEYFSLFSFDSKNNLAASKNKKAGLVNAAGTVIIPFEYDYVVNINSEDEIIGYTAINNFKSTFFDVNGKQISNDYFDYASPFYLGDGLYVIKKDDKYGYMDMNGEIVIKPQYEFASRFENGMACVELNNEYGCIDKQGNTVIEYQFDKMKSFGEDFAAVEIGGKWGYIDKSGKIKINPIYDDADSFSDGIAKVTVNQKIGYIDKNGEYKIEPIYDDADTFSDGIILSNSDGCATYNTKGEKLHQYKFKRIARIYSDSYIIAVNENKKYVLTDLDGKEIVSDADAIDIYDDPICAYADCYNSVYTYTNENEIYCIRHQNTYNSISK